MTTLREQIGCWGHERWKTEMVLQFPSIAGHLGFSWLDLCNRNESLSKNSDSEARVCDWSDSSVLTVGRFFPKVKTRLFQHCFSQHPFELNFSEDRSLATSPIASVLIAVGGLARLSLLRIVLASLRGQTGIDLEIVVVEQSEHSELRGKLPKDVMYIHNPSPDAEKGFNKSHALNVAAEHARGEFLFVHDGDYAVPRDYVQESLRIIGDHDGCRPARWLFHLDQGSTKSAIESDRISNPGIEKIVQNNPTPMVVTAEAYRRVGGHDESYFGWGGEDLEFLSRLRTSGNETGGTLPVVHLWHPAAPKKASGDRNQKQHDQLMAISPEERINRLKAEI